MCDDSKTLEDTVQHLQEQGLFRMLPAGNEQGRGDYQLLVQHATSQVNPLMWHQLLRNHHSVHHHLSDRNQEHKKTTMMLMTSTSAPNKLLSMFSSLVAHTCWQQTIWEMSGATGL